MKETQDTKPFTFRDLRFVIGGLTTQELDSRVMVLDLDGKFHPVDHFIWHRRNPELDESITYLLMK